MIIHFCRGKNNKKKNSHKEKRNQFLLEYHSTVKLQKAIIWIGEP